MNNSKNIGNKNGRSKTDFGSPEKENNYIQTRMFKNKFNHMLEFVYLSYIFAQLF